MTKTYLSSKQRLKVRCKNGHISVTCWNNFSRGTRCKRCFLETLGNEGLKKIVLRDKYYNISEAARVLKVRDSDLRYHIQLGTLPGPKHQLGATKKYYLLEDIKKIEEMIV